MDGPNGHSRLGPEIFEVRLLIPSNVAGSIIGRGGKNISKLRSEYKASVRVPDCSGPERILRVASSDVDDIVKVIGEVVPNLTDTSGHSTSGDDVDLRLLVHQSQLGYIIGKGGVKVKELREKTGAQLKIYTDCCPESTDRVVQLMGGETACTHCIQEILELLKSVPVKGVDNPYDPINLNDVYTNDYGGYNQGSGGGRKIMGGRNMGPAGRDMRVDRPAPFGGPPARGAGLGHSSEDEAHSTWVIGHRSGVVSTVSQHPPPGLHRLVLGQLNSQGSTDIEHSIAKASERKPDEMPGGNPPPGMHCMVLGEFRRKDPDPESSREKETVKSNDRGEDSDSDYRAGKRHRHPRDSEEEEERKRARIEEQASHRSTPPLYSSSHIRGTFNTLGQVVVVNPHDPFSYPDHQATVSVCKVAGPNAADDPDMLEFLQNPGPFISGVTHKNTVLRYLKKQSNFTSHTSEKLLYELIRLFIKLNGMIDMTDVASLLMESYCNNKTEVVDYQSKSSEVESASSLPPDEITSRFRELMLEGNTTEALEWAMKNKDWGKAFYWASKMDRKTYNNVALRYTSGVQSNDPLQTLDQLMSGREPQAATCAADKKWGDWRPHLAVMLSNNHMVNPELHCKAILTLGHSLGARGRLFAAHFCYLTGQLEFSNYSDRHAKLVLLGASPDWPFRQFASCRPIILTLSYEYAKQLSNKDWCIPTLRPYKFLLACRLFDHGNLAGALAYLKSLAQEMVRLPTWNDRPLVQLVADMADKIKGANMSLAFTTDPASDPDWLARLKLFMEEQESHQPYEPMGYQTQTDSHNGPTYTQDAYHDPSQNNYYGASQAIQNSQSFHRNSGWIQPTKSSLL